MKLMIFGTGAQLLAQSLDAGHGVTAVVRDPAKLAVREHPQLTVVEGDVLIAGAWQACASDQDAVLSCLGSTDRRHTTEVYSRGTANVLDAMGAADTRRLVCLPSAGLQMAAKTAFLQRLVTRLVIAPLPSWPTPTWPGWNRYSPPAPLAWSIIRAPMLTNGPLIGQCRGRDLLSRPRSISRADLAHYVLAHVLDHQTCQRSRSDISRG
jgi:nucleoside-diphosphate-sugar epimerase